MRPEARRKMRNVVSARWLLVKPFVGAIVIAASITSAVSPAIAQNRAEITGFFGYSFSEGIDVTRGTLLNEFIDHVNVGSSLSYGGAVNFWVDDQTQVGVQFGLQDSSLRVEGSSSREVTGMTVNGYHGIVTQHLGRSNSAVRPFGMFGLGATQYRPSDVLGLSFDSEWRFSYTLGVGAKAYLNERIGFTFTGRWTPTYIKSDVAGVYCSPYWSPWYGGGCAVLPDPDFSNQFELSGGIVFRF